jgi:hypothetical protein
LGLSGSIASAEDKSEQPLIPERDYFLFVEHPPGVYAGKKRQGKKSPC